MKKQTNLSRLHAGKLNLNKKTISNLGPLQMARKIGGYITTTCHGASAHCGGGGTKNGDTCPGHNTCYTC